MNKEDKELLLKDLCARLPYGVKVKTTYLSFAEDKLETKDINLNYYNAGYLDNHLIEIKPYLRPMSNMTEEEEKLWQTRESGFGKDVDFLNARHFDYRGLIPMGLALEATEGMYKFE